MIVFLVVRDRDALAAEKAIQAAGIRLYEFEPLHDPTIERAMFDLKEEDEVW